jgi:hypothetical protein
VAHAGRIKLCVINQEMFRFLHRSKSDEITPPTFFKYNRSGFLRPIGGKAGCQSFSCLFSAEKSIIFVIVIAKETRIVAIIKNYRQDLLKTINIREIPLQIILIDFSTCFVVFSSVIVWNPLREK